MIARVDDPCAVLPELRAAYYSLLTGGQTAQTRDSDRWLTKHRGDPRVLREEIARLEIQCDPILSRARAVRVGPYVPANRMPSGFLPPFGRRY